MALTTEVQEKFAELTQVREAEKAQVLAALESLQQKVAELADANNPAELIEALNAEIEGIKGIYEPEQPVA